MLPNEQELANENTTHYHAWIEEALDKAHAIVMERSSTRDVGVPIWQHLPLGLPSYVTLIYMKAARLVSMMKAQDLMHRSKRASLSSEELELFEAKIDDELLDIINYCSFAWAYRRLQGQQEKERVNVST